MPNWTLTKLILNNSVINSRIKWETMLVKNAVNATLVVLVAVVVNAIAAIEFRTSGYMTSHQSKVICKVCWPYICFFLQGMMFGLLIGVFHVTYPRWYGGTTHWMIVQPMTIQLLLTKWLRSLNRYKLHTQRGDSHIKKMDARQKLGTLNRYQDPVVWSMAWSVCHPWEVPILITAHHLLTCTCFFSLVP